MTDAQSAIVDTINRSPQSNRLSIIVSALKEYYSDKELTLSKSRDLAIVRLSTGSNDTDINRYFLESNTPISFSKTKELFNRFVSRLRSCEPIEGILAEVECITPVGIYKNGAVYSGKWAASKSGGLRLDFNQSLPGVTLHPSVTYDTAAKQISIQKQFKLL